MSGKSQPRRGEVWWVRVYKRRPAVVVQTDSVLDPRVMTFLVVPLPSRVHLAELPGNVRFRRSATGLPKPSVANVYDVQKVFRVDFLEVAGRLSRDVAQASLLEEIENKCPFPLTPDVAQASLPEEIENECPFLDFLTMVEGLNPTLAAQFSGTP